jgi:hypothetical protein
MELLVQVILLQQVQHKVVLVVLVILQVMVMKLLMLVPVVADQVVLVLLDQFQEALLELEVQEQQTILQDHVLPMVAEVVELLEKNLMVVIFLVELVDQAVVVLVEHELMELQQQ